MYEQKRKKKKRKKNKKQTYLFNKIYWKRTEI